MKSLRFQNWCNEIIISDNNDFITRKVWITRFLRDEIVPLLHKKGYYLYVSYDTLANEIASGLFTNNFNFVIRNIDNQETEVHKEDPYLIDSANVSYSTKF